MNVLSLSYGKDSLACLGACEQLGIKIDCPVSFKPDGHTVHDFDRRFQAEDDGLIIPNDRTFRWSQIDGEVQIKFF